MLAVKIKLEPDFYLRDPDDGGYLAFWRAVILMAFIDATYQLYEREPVATTIVVSHGVKAWANAARFFLLECRADFIRVCNFADLDPGAVRDRAREAIAEHDKRYVIVTPEKLARKPYRRRLLAA